MATVYRANDPSFDREIALKVLPREFLHDPQFAGRFSREIKTIAKLEHPAIVPVYDVGEEDGQPFFVMRYMPGGSLSDWIKRGKFSLQDTARIVERLAGALAYTHAKGIVHRDLKPDNILFDSNGNPFISDFGIAKLDEATSTLTGSAVVGTPAYMSPEQAQGDKADNRSDIYGLGVIIFQMLVGKQPYQADTPMGVVVKHITEPVPEILDFDPTLPDEVDSFIKKALAKNKDDRFATVVELAKELNLIAFGEEGAITDAAATKLGKRPTASSGSRLGIIIGSAVLLLALLGGFVFRDKLFGGAAPEPTSTSVPAPTETNTAVPATATESPPTATQEPSPPTDSPTAIPIPGGTDKIAFISGKEIWVMNPDGTGITPVTNTGSGKSFMQWMPDGKSLMYLTGNCAYSVDSETRQTETIFCLDPRSSGFIEGPRLSPDGSMLALSLNRELLIVPFNKGELSQAQNKGDLLRIENSCSYPGVSTKDMRWSKDGKRIGVISIDTTDRVNVERISVLDVSNCAAGGIFAVAQFPSRENPLSGYQNDPIIPGFDWDGDQRFLLNDFVRNEGFGNLYLYDMATQTLELFNPIDDSCCYRDARWSPDGQYVLFLFQDIRQGSTSRNQFYFVSFDDLLNGKPGTPFTMPVGIFSNLREQPDPSFRPVQ